VDLTFKLLGSQREATALPHHKLVAYQVSLEFAAVRAAAIRDANLRDQAMRAAKSACLNTAEGAGRKSRADKARVFAIARGEACEAVAAVEIAAAAGDAGDEAARNAVRVAGRLVVLLTGLSR
jgi:four helix bundle protein